MLDRLRWRTFSRIEVILSAITIVGTIVAATVAIVEGWPWLTILLGSVAIAFALAATSFFVIEILDSRKLRLELEPSSNRERDARLLVTNKGPQARFRAKCELLEWCSDDLGFGAGGEVPYALRWIESDTHSEEITTGGSASLLIAELRVFEHKGGRAELTFPEYGFGQPQKIYRHVDWILEEQPPEYLLRVTISSDKHRQPHASAYKLRFYAAHGPIGLFKLSTSMASGASTR